MKKLVSILFLTIAMGTSAYAGGNAQIPNWHKLTKVQQAEITLQAAKAAETVPLNVPTAASVKEYSELVNAIGTGVKDTAVQLGVAANDFIKTPVGMLTAGFIAWNYVGDTFLGIIAGGIWFMFMLPAWIYVYRRLALINSIEYYAKGAREDGKRKVVTYADKFDSKIGEGLHFILFIALIMICGTGFIVIFA